MKKTKNKNEWEKEFDRQFPKLPITNGDYVAGYRDEIKQFIQKEIDRQRKETIGQIQQEFTRTRDLLSGDRIFYGFLTKLYIWGKEANIKLSKLKSKI